MKRFMLAGVLMITAVCIVFVSCRKNEGEASGGNTSSSAKVEELVFWTSAGDRELECYTLLVDQWNKENPSIQVTLEQIAGGSTDITKLMTAVRGGVGPDIYMFDRFAVAQRAAEGLLADMTPYLDKIDPNLKDKYLESAWAETQWRGKTYALPQETDARALYYNPRLLKEAGADLSLFDPKNGPITWEKFKEISMQLNKKDTQGLYTQVGCIPWAFGNSGTYAFFYIFGAPIIDRKAGKLLLDGEPNALAAYQALYDWGSEMDPQKAQTFISSYAPPNNPPAQHAFMIEKVAMVLNGDWYMASLEMYAPELEYGVTYFPVAKAGDKPVTWIGGWSNIVPEGAKHPEAAVKFIHWACGPVGQREYVRITKHLPTYKSLYEEDIFSETHLFFRDLMQYAKSRPVLPIGSAMYSTLARVFSANNLHETTPAQALKDAQDELQPMLEKWLPLD